ncbi:MAG: DNA mismatch repair endonuclease MutL, partial [Phycisphaerales bacterium]|nr:DNA mismatch repair endonuclease MutL [Phycisphaerales bacterium]
VTGPARIRRLSDLLINQIAAGEVIERPASVVKELVENSLDAGARRIVIDLEQGGIELVRVTDDGRGIEPDDLPLAISSHATSKIHVAEDLDRIMTMGFRGEALASIVSISRLSIRSRVATNDEAFLIEGEGESIREARPDAGPVGTQITCRNLFFNTPARRKFLRTATTEQTRCLEWIRDLAMSHPGIGFKVTCDGRVRTDLPPEQSARERVVAVLGAEVESELVEVKGDPLDRGVVLWGLAGLPSLARATPRAQHVFLNGRAIRDRSIQHALREAYRGLIEPGRHPTCVLMLEVPPDRVDVNVHPAKLEVRFRDQSLVHSLVHRAVRDALQRS